MRIYFIILWIVSGNGFLLNAQQSIPIVQYGKIERVENFPSRFVTSRNIDIWLPEHYSTDKKYSVLYMQDGQMLYDSTITWNHQEWMVDETAHQLFTDKGITEFIVVGIWNGGNTRHQDYFPQKPFELLTLAEQDTITAQLQVAGRTKDKFRPNSDHYLKFIVKELKPYIDKKYSVYTTKKNTFIAGSSMGGLISMYAICEYPQIFGGAACLSTHWIGTFNAVNNPIPSSLLTYLKTHLPNPKSHKIYFDCGDQTLDALYPAIQRQVDSVMIFHGYTSKNWLTKYFPGDDHSEKSWCRRLWMPLEFLMGEQYIRRREDYKN
jgi:enterochelin esterase-like enzyme